MQLDAHYGIALRRAPDVRCACEEAYGPADGTSVGSLRELLGLLDSLGVTTLVPLGERFDPSLHQAILHEPAAGFEAGTVAEVYRKGYQYKDRLLRPALVKVASAGSPEAGGADVQ